jgi:hypothetical protein
MLWLDALDGVQQEVAQVLGAIAALGQRVTEERQQRVLQEMGGIEKVRQCVAHQAHERRRRLPGGPNGTDVVEVHHHSIVSRWPKLG